jgi:hypothetical protein
MCGVMDRWNRGKQQASPFVDYRYRETPLEMEESLLPEEQEWATSTGWTLPCYFKFNLRQFGNGAILKELDEWLKAERKRLSLISPEAGSPSSKRKSFHAIECIDVWRNLAPAERPKEDRHGRAYNGGQKRRAVGEAKKLRAEWQANAKKT